MLSLRHVLLSQPLFQEKQALNFLEPVFTDLKMFKSCFPTFISHNHIFCLHFLHIAEKQQLQDHWTSIFQIQSFIQEMPYLLLSIFTIIYSFFLELSQLAVLFPTVFVDSLISAMRPDFLSRPSHLCWIFPLVIF